jgi:hypothetical protein
MYSDILPEIWGHSEGEYIFLPVMQGQWSYGERLTQWQEGPAWDVKQAISALSEIDDLADSTDRYFTPLRYTHPKRRIEHLGNPGVIFADLDSDEAMAKVDGDWRAPSVLIETSPGHYHGYWYLNGPVDLAEWLSASAGWTDFLGADPGGWDATQVLRIPGTLNHKSRLAMKHRVRVVSHEQREYNLVDFPTRYVTSTTHLTAPTPSLQKRASYITRALEIGNLPQSLLYWLTVSRSDFAVLGSVDRSAMMWRTIKQLSENGYTPIEIFHLTYFTAFNKWDNDPDKLWREVRKATA